MPFLGGTVSPGSLLLWLERRWSRRRHRVPKSMPPLDYLSPLTMLLAWLISRPSNVTTRLLWQIRIERSDSTFSVLVFTDRQFKDLWVLGDLTDGYASVVWFNPRQQRSTTQPLPPHLCDIWFIYRWAYIRMHTHTQISMCIYIQVYIYMNSLCMYFYIESICVSSSKNAHNFTSSIW